MDASSSLVVSSKRIKLFEDEIPFPELMENFQSQIYKYIKYSHSYRWKTYEFKNSHEVFDPLKILLVVEFAENYTFYPHTKIQSEYYHFEQVSILVHVLYIHA